MITRREALDMLQYRMDIASSDGLYNDLVAVSEFIRTDGWETTDLNPPPPKTYVLAYSERIGTCIAARFPDCKWADSSGLDVSPCPYWKELESPPYL